MKIRLFNERTWTIINNVISLILFHSLFWFCNIYPRHLLEFDSVHSLGAIILNLIFHVLYFSFLTICFTKKTHPFAEKLFDWSDRFLLRKYIKKVAILILLQVLLDLIKFLFLPGLSDYAFVLSDLITLVGWVFIYFILAMEDETESLRLTKGRIIILLLALLGIGLCLFFDFKAINNYQGLMQKITSEQTTWTQYIDNLAFDHSNRNFLLDTFLGCLFFVECMRTKTPVASAHPMRKIKIASGLFSRIFLICLLMIGLVGAKLLVFPDHSFIRHHRIGSVLTTYEDENHFDADFNTTAVYRLNDKREQICHYYKTTYKILFGNAKSMKKISAFSLSESESDFGEESVKYQSSSFDLEHIHVKVYYNWAICYAEDDIPTVVFFDEIAKQPKNEILISVCKKMIAEGNVLAFEYASEYLNQYDPSFIQYYADRYSRGNFNSAETEYIEDYEYREEYLISLAQKYVS